MAIKIDAVPGRINDSFSFIERPGVFYGQCSELCGVGHGFMPIVVEALDVANFMAWAQKSQSQ
jgi:heme/copper-type cytochrome/quinol oxidase subunit 2